MLVLVKRIFNCSKYCISHIYVDGVYVCDGIEDTDRMLDSSMSETYIYKKKVPAQTAIPIGKYKLTLNIISPKFSKKQYYMDVCKGRVPRVLAVKGFDGILIHVGNTEKDSAGCLIVGYNKVKGKVLYSKQAFEKLYAILKQSKDDIDIEYIRTY